MSYFLYRLKWMNLWFSPQPVMEPQTPLTHLHKPLQLAPFPLGYASTPLRQMGGSVSLTLPNLSPQPSPWVFGQVASSPSSSGYRTI